MKSDHFGKCFHLIFLYIIGYKILEGRIYSYKSLKQWGEIQPNSM